LTCGSWLFLFLMDRDMSMRRPNLQCLSL
jgi:hypothetical protein